MRWIGITIGCIVLAGALFVALIFGVSESGGEIITLRTLDEAGQPHETRLWIVDDGGYEWLRSGQPTSGWFVRLESNPNVEVARDHSTGSYRAEPVREPEVRDRIHALMAKKYGAAESFIAASRDGDLSVAIRLVPRTEVKAPK
jgi:hypothetical protein